MAATAHVLSHANDRHDDVVDVFSADSDDAPVGAGVDDLVVDRGQQRSMSGTGSSTVITASTMRESMRSMP